MATKLDGFDKLKEQITCPICLGNFTNPKILPCFHSFCLHCIESTPLDGHNLTCPICRSPHPVLDIGLAALPSSFLINNLMEVYDLMKKVNLTGEQGIASTAACSNCEETNADQYCKQCAKCFCPQCLPVHDNWKPNNGHQTIKIEEIVTTLLRDRPQKTLNCTNHEEPLRVFCETCNELICQLCIIQKHRDHQYEVIEESTHRKHHDIIDKSSLQPLNQAIDQLAQAKEVLINRTGKVAQQAKETEKEVDEMINELKASLDSVGEKLKGNVKVLSKIKLAVLQKQLKDLDKDLDMLTDCKDYVDQSLEISSTQQILASKAHIMDQSASVISSINDKNYHPCVEADIELVKKPINHGIWGSFAKVNFPSSFLATCDIVCPRTPLVGQMSNVSLYFFFPDGSPAPVPFSLVECSLNPPPNHGKPIKCLVKESRSQSGLYDVSFTPVTRGRHQLHVHIVMQDKEVPGSPMDVTVTIPHDMMTKPVNTVTGEFKEPRGIAVSSDGVVLVISENDGHCITIFGSSGYKKVGCKGSEKGQLKHPRGVVITSGKTILVADKGNHRIQGFSLDLGKWEFCVGGRGSDLQFNHPHGLSIDKATENVFIADHGNNRVVVLDPQLKFVSSFGNQVLYHPQDVTVDRKGFVYVIDEKNCVHKFTTDGQFVRSFIMNDMSALCGVTVNDSDLLYVNRRDGYVSVLTTNGEQKGLINKCSIASHSCKFQSLCYCECSGHLYVLDAEVKIY